MRGRGLLCRHFTIVDVVTVVVAAGGSEPVRGAV